MTQNTEQPRDTSGTTSVRNTYVRRRGRMTAGQKRALSTLSSRYLLPASERVDPAQCFGRAARVGLEIGFGMGQALVDWAAQAPEWNLLGVDVYQPGLGACMAALDREALTNVRLLEADARDVVDRLLPDQSLDEVRILFPDPWPKARHHKRRLLNDAFLDALAPRLKEGAGLWIATDWQPYAEEIRALFHKHHVFRPAQALPRRQRTRFETRGLALGHDVWQAYYRYDASGTAPGLPSQKPGDD